MKILAIIPARAGSKRVPGKNFKRLGRILLIEHTIIACQQSSLIDDIVITSDHDRAPQIAERHNTWFVKRPAHLADDKTDDYPVILHTVKEMMSQFEKEYDLVCYMRPTTPFRATHHIDTAIQYMIDAPDKITGLRSVEEMPESAYKCFQVHSGLLQPIMYEDINCTDWPSQSVPKTYKANGYIDICRPHKLCEGVLWGDNVGAYLTPQTIEIDTPNDWDLAEFISRNQVYSDLKFDKEIASL